MSNPIKVHVGRTNRLNVNLGFNITGDTITSQIRAEQDQTSTLIATWTVTVNSAPTGDITLTIDDSISSAITAKTGFMDLKRVSGDEPLPVFDAPLEVVFVPSVTA